MPVDVFDVNFYQSAHSDLASFNEQQARSHFQAYGLNEGRGFSPIVNLNTYRSSNSDLASFNNHQLLNHLQNYGIREGRKFSPLADLNFYRTHNRDLAHFNNEQVFEHLRSHGIMEGRRFSPFVDLKLYRAANTDLNYHASFDNKQLLEHLAKSGIVEGRQFSVSFDSNYYRNHHSDLARVGLNNWQLLEHFQGYGIREGRAAAESFSVQFYLTNNTDLRTAGFSYQQAQHHFEVFGFSEGRRATSVNFSLTNDPGNTFNSAFNLGVLNSSHRVANNFVGNTDSNDYYRFTLNNRSNFNLVLNGMSSDADVELFNSDGNLLQHSINGGTTPDIINQTLEAGVYYIRVFPWGGANTNYNLNVSATAVLPTRANWTFMVYMAGNDLEDFGIQDFQEMATVGSNANVNIVFQFDRTSGYNSSYSDWTDTRRGLIQAASHPDLSCGISIGEANMGDPNTLRNFINWSMNNYQANNYALVLWGHGSGFNVSYDDITNDSISASELSRVLSSFARNIDLVGCDACQMGMTEFAYQIRDYASVYVGSQENIPGTGWNYTTILSDLRANPTMSAIGLGNAIVNRYGQHYSSTWYNGCEETLSAINLTNLRSSNPHNLAATLSQFAHTIMNNAFYSDLYRLEVHRDNSAFFENLDYRDLGTFLNHVANDFWMTNTIRTSAQTALNSYNSTIIQNYSSIHQRGTGLSIYFSAAGFSPESHYHSSNLSFAQNTAWDDFLNWAHW
jgi:hypothetical protein